jgi:hypothetical protein
MKRFNPEKLNDTEVKEQYQIKIFNSFVALENLDNNVGINGAWASTVENKKTSAEVLLL